MKKPFTIFCFFIFLQTFAQPSFNANITVPVYNGGFYFGSNMGYYGSSGWSDEKLAEIAAGNAGKSIPGAGVKTLRPTLPGYFVEQYGYNVRLDAFKFYNSLGIKDNTVFLDKPSPTQIDKNKYEGCKDQSKVFANLYQPIWDGGVNGTPVNENNYYALYVYETVKVYKNYVKFWEIWNEPDYDFGANGWKEPGQPGNWFDKNPSPCEMENLKAPIFYYNRMLRISYEVIKSIDPSAYVTTGGIGYPGFLDAILRNTDNPSGGVVSSDYPYKAGAYFDVLSYHKYPMFDLKNNRHSDAAANDLVDAKKSFQTVLSKYGYGSTYPNKLWIITEANIPRKAIGEYIGGEDVQRNFLIKASVLCQKNDIRQLYVFTIGEGDDISASNPNGLMGLYKNLNVDKPYAQVINNEGIGYKTTSDLLSGYFYDPTKTTSLSLGSDIDGGAFQSKDGKYIYILWAKTMTDRSENANAIFSFPNSANVSDQLHRREWDYSSSPSTKDISSKNISLSGAPSFFIDSNVNPDPQPVTNPGPLATEDEIEILNLKIFPNPSSQSFVANYEIFKSEKVTMQIIDAKGRILKKVIDNVLQFPGPQTIEIKLNDIKEGPYFCKFILGDKSVVKKIIKIN